MTNATTSKGEGNAGSNNSVFLHLKRLLEANQIGAAIDYALNASWGEDYLVEAAKERIHSLIRDNPQAALNLLLAVRDKFPKRGEDLIVYFSKEMRATGV